MASTKSLNSDDTITSPTSAPATRILPFAANVLEGEPIELPTSNGMHPTNRLGPASARPATPSPQPDAMGGRTAAPVPGKWKILNEPSGPATLEGWKIVLSLTSQATPAHVEPAGPARRNVAVPSGTPGSGVLLKMLMSIA